MTGQLALRWCQKLTGEKGPLKGMSEMNPARPPSKSPLHSMFPASAPMPGSAAVPGALHLMPRPGHCTHSTAGAAPPVQK